MPYLMGKRFRCETCGTQVLVTRASNDGTLECCTQPMVEEEPKQLASSD